MGYTKIAEPIEMPFGIWAWIGPRIARNRIFDEVRIPHVNGIFLWKRAPIVKYRDRLP